MTKPRKLIDGNVSRFGPGLSTGFSLVELLVVITIISLLTALLVPAITQALASHRLTVATWDLASQMALARQTAIATHAPMELRLYQLSDEMGRMNFQATRLFKRDNFTNAGIPYAPIRHLPVGIVVMAQTNYSTLVTDTVQTNTEILPGQPLAVPYRVIRFMPSGRADLTVTDTNGVRRAWTMTLADSRFATNGQPDNFSVLTLDPLTGKTQIYRP